MKRLAILLVTITVALLLLRKGVSGAEAGPIYMSPRPGAHLVQAESTIIFRFAEAVDAGSLADTLLQVTGSISGNHEGSMFLAADGRTVIFEPWEPFAPAETVKVGLNPGLLSNNGNKLFMNNFEFAVSPQTDMGFHPTRAVVPVELLGIGPRMDGLSFMNKSANSNVTVTPNFPEITISTPANGTDDGYVFLSNFIVDWRNGNVSESRSYLMILDNEGEPIFYKAMPPGIPGMDFKKQPNGLLTYGEWAGDFYGMDSSYDIVKTYKAKNGYRTDIHDLQILADDHVLVMIYDRQPVDMTAYGGLPDAMVIGLVIQEQDSDGNVVFQWRSWDHFKFEESRVDLTRANIDPVHGNSFELDFDGNLIISSRTMDEITKIDRQTGEIIWRLGGKANEFKFINDPEPFFAQHDARRLANGNITIFDNHTSRDSKYARTVEYKLNETGPNKTATLVWEYRSSAMSPAMGNAQRLPNGNTMIGWGTLYPSLQEVKPNGEVAFELTLTPPADPNLSQNSYRAFRFEWEGEPATKARLVVTNESPGIASLYTSWNGATNVSAYRVFGGETADNLALLESVDKDGFETKILIADAAEKYCYYQVMPLDKDGQNTVFSELAIAPHCIINRVLMPVIVAGNGNS